MDGRVRIARIIARLNVGGPATHVSLLTSRLPANRFDTLLITGQVSSGEVEMTDVLEREGVTPTRIPELGRSANPFRDIAAFRRLIDELRRFRPHIVHTHTSKAGALGRAAARLLRIPYVVHTYHGHVFEGYFHPWVTRTIINAERTLARLTDVVVTISPRQHVDLTQRFRVVPPERTRVIPLGFDLSRFDDVSMYRGQVRRELGIPDGVPIVTSLGRLVPIKDYPLLLRAFAVMRNKDARLVLVGDGDERQSLEQLAGELGISLRVHFLGFRSDVQRLLADTTVVALTSKNEGTPVALIEALAVGCQVVATDVGGVSDVLANGEYGRLVSSRAPTAFAEALDQSIAFAASPSAHDRSQRARDYVRQRYGFERLVAEHVSLYDYLLSGAAPMRSAVEPLFNARGKLS